MSTGGTVGILVGIVMRSVRGRSTQIRMQVVMRRRMQMLIRIVPQLAKIRLSSEQPWHVDVKEAHRHA